MTDDHISALLDHLLEFLNKSHDITGDLRHFAAALGQHEAANMLDGILCDLLNARTSLNKFVSDPTQS
jgi:hypothetical protein